MNLGDLLSLLPFVSLTMSQYQQQQQLLQQQVTHPLRKQQQ